MKEKIQELLSVLDMTEEEQYEWVSQYCKDNYIDNEITISHPNLGFDDYEIECSLADLAFRMRDEADKARLTLARIEVFKAIKEPVHFEEAKYLEYWWNSYAQPIHWIIAALIAKELEKRK